MLALSAIPSTVTAPDRLEGVFNAKIHPCEGRRRLQICLSHLSHEFEPGRSWSGAAHPYCLLAGIGSKIIRDPFPEFTQSVLHN